MKVLVLLSLLALVAAKPQLIWPYATTPLVTPTVKASGDAPVISTYTASYPYGGFPWVQAALPYNFNYPYNFAPIITNAKPAEETTRAKRSADPEPEAQPEADPALVYTTGLTGSAINYPIATTAGINYQYTGLPAAVSTYTYPQTIPYTGVTSLPYTGFPRYQPAFSPYTTFPFFTPVAATAKAAEEKTEEAVGRAKRSADPEADPQLLTTGFTGFSYPAVNTRTSPSTYTYRTFPTTYAGTPSIFTNAYQYGTYPGVTTYFG